MKAADRLLWWLFAGSMGGKNRARIARLLMEEPSNLNQISEKLGLNYKTAQHHVRIMVENNVLVVQGQHYGKIYFPSSFFEENIEDFEKIWVRIVGKGLSDDGDEVVP